MYCVFRLCQIKYYHTLPYHTNILYDHSDTVSYSHLAIHVYNNLTNFDVICFLFVYI